MATNPPPIQPLSLSLIRATPSDVPSIVSTIFAAFKSLNVFLPLFNHDTPAGRATMAEMYTRGMTEDSNDIWMKMIDTQTGQIVCAANWKVYTSWAPVHEEKGDPPLQCPHFEEGSTERRAAEMVLNVFAERRKRWMSGSPRLLLHCLGTHPDYQGRGCGSMMMRWGCGLADHLGLPLWTESSVAGHKLYLNAGLVDVEEAVDVTEKPEWTHRYFVMKRKAKSQDSESEDDGKGGRTTLV